MLQTTGIALILGVWASLYLLDAFLKGHRSLSKWYFNFLGESGLSVSIAQIRWYTTCVNRLFLKLGQIKPRLLRQWFTLGVWVSMVGMVISICILSLMIVNTFQRKPVEHQVLTPVMPGVNLPVNQVGYYLLTLLFCGILHEAGHAVAAVREQVRVNGFGVFILGVYPGAFVDLYTEQLQVISPMRQLRIFCAGVWHNVVIVVVALIVLILLPWILMPFFHTGRSVVITSVVPKSPVDGPRGLMEGEHVTSISGCRTTNILDWSTCIHVSMQEKSLGYCMPLETVKEQDVSLKTHRTTLGNVECCGNTSNTHLCFFYNKKASSSEQFACLPARTTTDRQACKLQSDCYNPKTPSVCVQPSLDNSTKLLKVHHKGKPPLLFLGHPLDLHYSVTLSDYVPAYRFVPLHIPYMVETFSKYLISLSGALALLNVVPCYALDGQWILLSFIELSLTSVIRNPEHRGLVYFVILTFGTILLGLNIFIAMWTLFT